jgi:phosphatidylserine/phosphatidylglycerophosphate/cardiolipin synthase-like enzyme
MRNRIIPAGLVLALLAMAVLVVQGYDPLHPRMPRTASRKLPPIEVYFSPSGGCTDAVVREIRAARHTILVQAYSFTSNRIARALADAHNRGVDVKVIIDKEIASEYFMADRLCDAGIPVSTDAIHAHAHNKVMILDGEVVITGSFNFTDQAEHSNAENLLVIRDRAIAKQYEDNWREHAGHSEAYSGRQPGTPPPSRRGSRPAVAI